MNKRNILIISSKPPTHSAGLGNSNIKMYESAGLNVEYMTIYDYPNKAKNIITLIPAPIPQRNSVFRNWFVLPIRQTLVSLGLYSVVKCFKDRLLTSRKHQNKEGLSFLYPDETNPPIPVDLITKNITKNYDAVITGFWEGMLNSTSLVAIYEKLKCPIIIGAPDMAPMTGGCYYFGSCKNFHTGCGNCPALNSKVLEDQSRVNFLTKKENYSKIKCAFLGNTWMLEHAKESKLFSNLFLSEIIINEDLFKPYDLSLSRQELGISDNNRFKILVSSSSMPRKGNIDIVVALKKITENCSIEELESLEILVIGDDFFSKICENQINQLRMTYLGRVDMQKLIKCYQASNLFLCSSIDDAGPSMINQSIMCGTPVVCYDSGTSIDVIENGVSGFKTTLRNTDGLADSILKIFKMPQDRYRILRETTREMALKHNSVEAGLNRRLHAIETMINKK